MENGRGKLGTMKIVHICLSGLYMSGWGYQDNMLAKYHKLSGHAVYVIANRFMYDHEGNYVKIDNKLYCQPEVDENGVRVIRLEVKEKRNLTGPAQRVHYEGLYKSLDEIKPDIVFLHNPQIMDTGDIAKYMSENKESRLYVDSHSDYSNSGRNFLSKHILHGILWRSKVKKLIPYTEKFYGVLPARVDFLLDRYKTPKDKTELLVMGMDDETATKAKTPEKKQEIKNSLGITEKDFFVITGGKIDAAKRQTLLLIDAAREIEKVKLIIFGSIAEDMKEEIRHKSDIFVENVSELNSYDKDVLTKARIVYIGWLEAKETYPYFEAADIAVFPGRHSVMWEQVAGQGRPMIVKYWEGTTHVDLGGNCEFLYKDSSEEIKERLLSLCSKGEKYQDMKRKASEDGPKIFSYSAISKRCIE